MTREERAEKRKVGDKEMKYLRKKREQERETDVTLTQVAGNILWDILNSPKLF